LDRLNLLPKNILRLQIWINYEKWQSENLEQI
jgi:hypothetical protein